MLLLCLVVLKNPYLLNAVLVGMGCHNKTPRTGWLRQQEFLSHGLRDWKSDIRVLTQGDAADEITIPWVTSGPLLTRYSHGLSLMPVNGERGKLFDVTSYRVLITS